jgi:hypothetical protein
MDLIKSAIEGNKEAIKQLIDLSGTELLVDAGINIKEGAG